MTTDIDTTNLNDDDKALLIGKRAWNSRYKLRRDTLEAADILKDARYAFDGFRLNGGIWPDGWSEERMGQALAAAESMTDGAYGRVAFVVGEVG